MSFDGLRTVGFSLFFLGLALTTLSEILFMLLVGEINARRPNTQQISILERVLMGPFNRREKTRMIVRHHQRLFPDSWKCDGFDNTRFFGVLSAFAGFALLIVTGFS
jgi:hypothetical protein